MTQPLNDLGALVAHRYLLQEYLEFSFSPTTKVCEF
jgi:hypothetical protein